MPSNFTLREMQPSDSPALTALVKDLSDTAGIGMTTHFHMDTYRALLFGDHHRTVGVVAEADQGGELAGMAVVTFGQCQYEGQIRPYALLSSLKVHQRFRQQGLGSQLAQWRVERAQTENGADGVILTGMQRSNDASRATARKWANAFLEPIIAIPAPMRDQPPPALPGIEIRPVTEYDLAEVTEKQNRFYRDHNFYEPQTTETLAAWLRYSPIESPINSMFVAVTPSGEILAGASFTLRHRMMVDVFHNPPPPLQAMLPPDYTLREVQVNGIWYLPGQQAAAQQVWETIRWTLREHSTNLTATFDPHGPLAEVFEGGPAQAMHVEIALAVRGPVPLDQKRLAYVAGRR